VAGPGMQPTKMTRPRGTLAMPMRDERHRDADVRAFDAMASARPKRPPPFAFAPRHLGTGARQAQLDNARVVGLREVPEQLEAAEQGDTLTVVSL
jgi:hypothetical protein